MGRKMREKGEKRKGGRWVRERSERQGTERERGRERGIGRDDGES